MVAIIAMARSMNLRLVAEGWKRWEQYRFLTRNGAHVIQGYLFSKPLPAEELRPCWRPGTSWSRYTSWNPRAWRNRRWACRGWRDSRAAGGEWEASGSSTRPGCLPFR